jgi:hypothetical protein
LAAPGQTSIRRARHTLVVAAHSASAMVGLLGSGHHLILDVDRFEAFLVM